MSNLPAGEVDQQGTMIRTTEGEKSLEILQQRMNTIRAKIKEKENFAHALTEDAKGKIRAVIVYADETAVDKADAEGRIGLLERSLQILPSVQRTYEYDDFLGKYIDSPYLSLLTQILSRVREIQSFSSPENVLSLRQRIEAIDPLAPDASQLLTEIAQSLGISPKVSTEAVTSNPIRSSDRLNPFASKDEKQSLEQRSLALRQKLQQLVAMDGIMTDEARSTRSEAIKYLDSIVVSDPEASGKLTFLEDAFDVHPPVYRG